MASRLRRNRAPARETYSAPSRLISETLAVRVRAETLELSVGSTLTLPRLHGRFGCHVCSFFHLN